MDALLAAYSNPAMRQLWSDSSVLSEMLHFEACLAHAQAQCGVIPQPVADVIQNVANSLTPDALDIGIEARRAGTLAIPLIKRLKAAVAQQLPESAHLVHWGSTSQDVVDTAVVVLAKKSLSLLLDDMARLGDAFASLVQANLRTPILARTLMQPAAPISFGWKAAGWLDAVSRCTVALQRVQTETAVLQFGGANGALLLHGAEGADVARELARRLQLTAPDISWHGARDRFARLATELAITCGMLGKFGRDISLLMQAEVGEAAEPSGQGRGGSSAMPHKRNPVASMHMLDAAYRAPALAQILMGELPAEHERGLGSWPNALPTLETLFNLCSNSLSAAVETAEGLQLNPQAMQANIDALHGVVFSESLNSAVASVLGPARASEVIAEASAQAITKSQHLVGVLAKHPALAGRLELGELNAACRIDEQLNGALPMCENVVQAWSQIRATLGGNHTTEIS